ncbi:hypothetical protein A7U60_g6575 [Sanghuangporus baumii]|uniref:Uncharacterized protein n=1 Tax=Sanghuangporus baumii TaxID=108892 RepID=A0A9Q5HUW3_SANBA|nr:hypothetical protein A7U60_g6575 [Sanghuangporus baumii]
MHLPLRRNTRRGNSPPKAAPVPPETSGMTGAHEQLPHDSTATALPQQNQQSSPHGLKGLGRSFSKPVRMLKTIASRSSLRNPAHGRRASGVSVHSIGSQQEAVDHAHEHEHEHGHEPDVKEERESMDTDYGKEFARGSGSEDKPVGEEKKSSEGGQQQQQENVKGEHEEAVRQEPVKVQEESQTRVEDEAVNAVDDTQKATPAVEAATAPVATDAKEDVKSVAAIDTQHDSRQLKEATAGASVVPEPEPETPSTSAPADSVVLVPSQNAETISLSSSSTTVDPPTAKDNIKSNGDASGKVVQAKMQQESEVAKSEDADVNPFLVDDPEDPLSDPESQKDAAGTPVVQSATLSKELESTDETAVEQKEPAPPTPPEKPAAATVTTTSTGSTASPKSSSSSEDETPELHAPALTATSLFLPVPQTDPLSALLTKYVPEPHLRPPRDTSGEWQHTDFHTLVMTNNWRALARMARDRIVTANPQDVELILNLWYIRLSSLARLRLFNQTSAECENLFSVLYTIEPPSARAYILRSVLPFELEVLRARCAYWAGDHLGYLDDVSALLHRCRVRARQAGMPMAGELGRDERAMWMERGGRMALIVASQLVEMKDYTAATTLLEPLSLTGSSPPSPALRSAIARIYLQGGNLAAAQTHFDAVDADPEAEASLKMMNAVISAAALGDWVRAAESARSLLEADAEREGEASDVVAANNYAVALLGQGRIKEGIQILEATLQASPSATTTTEPYLFNLSTMYELRAGLTARRKRDLLIEVAKWSGDGLRTACLKLNA